MTSWFLALLFWVGTLFVALPAQAVDPLSTTPPSTASAAPAFRDPLGRETPEGMVRGLLKAMAEQDYDRAASYLDVPAKRSARRGMKGSELAEGLQYILDKGGSLEANWKLSSAPEGRLDDGLDSSLERFATVRTSVGPVDLIAQRTGGGADEGQIWLVSSGTVSQIPTLMEQVETGLLERFLPPELLVGPRFQGVLLAHWGALFLLVAFAYLGSAVLTAVTRRVAYGLWGRQTASLRLRLVEAAMAPLRVCLTVWMFALGGLYLGVSVVARQTLGWLAEMVGWVGLAWFVMRIIDALGDASLERISRQGKVGALAAIRFFRRAAKVVVLATAVFFVMDALGFNVSTGLAALGIGGLAVALGAQKTIENLVGSLMLIADRPIREGDFCRFGQTLGTIEDIGMRSTRVRTLARTVVAIPNGQLAAIEIENYSRRDLYWYHPLLSLRLDTTPDQIRYLLVKLRELLYAHPRVDPTPARVRFLGVSRDSLTIEIFAYVRAEDISDFLEVQEDLSLQVMDIVSGSGASYALPSQTLYMGRDTPSDPERRAAAEDQVRSWRELGTLPIPRFPEERIAALKASVPYPPLGSAGQVCEAEEPPDAASPGSQDANARPEGASGKWLSRWPRRRRP